MGDLEKAIATGFVTLAVGFVLLQAQLGGTRRRLRRELHEELELLDQLDADTYPDAHTRLSARVAVLLERYEPPPAERNDSSEPRVETALLFVVAAGFAALIGSTLPNPQFPALFVVGAIAGTSVAVAAAMFRARARLKEVATAMKEARGSVDEYRRDRRKPDGPPAGP